MKKNWEEVERMGGGGTDFQGEEGSNLTSPSSDTGCNLKRENLFKWHETVGIPRYLSEAAMSQLLTLVVEARM